jgi:V/A-type H+/Na+-transporting ATPase subunit C
LQFSWPSSSGTLRVQSLNFLTKEQLFDLAKAEDVEQIAQRLESTWYRTYMESARAEFKNPEAIEVAVNRHLVDTNRIALQSSSMFQKNAIAAYLSKWDIENIELIIAAKSLGRGLEQAGPFLVSSRNVPVSFGSLIPLSELQGLLQQPDVESVLNSLVKYGYGSVLLPQLGNFRKSGDLGVFSTALQNYYYSKLLWELRFLQGDEGVIREYIRAEISKKNILTLLKARESKLDKETFARHLIEGGLIPNDSLTEAYSSPSLGDIVKRFEPWFDLSASLEKYNQSSNLTEFEVSIDKLIVSKYIGKFRSFSISIVTIFGFILQAEFERQNIRRITYAKQYRMTEEYIRSIILTW